MNRAPFDIFGGPKTVDGLAKDVEHSRQNSRPNRHFQRLAGILDDRSAAQPLRRRQRDPADELRVALGQYLNDDLAIVSGQNGVDLRQKMLKLDIDHAAADGHDLALIRFLHCALRNRSYAPNLQYSHIIDFAASQLDLFRSVVADAVMRG